MIAHPVRRRTRGNKRLDALRLRGHERMLREAMARGAATVRDEARSLLSDLGQGAPSPPGEAPHRQTGRLRDSVFVDVHPDGSAASIGTDLAYGMHLEIGTRHMAPRPWLSPAFDATKAEVRQIVGDAVRRALAASIGGRPDL